MAASSRGNSSQTSDLLCDLTAVLSSEHFLYASGHIILAAISELRRCKIHCAEQTHKVHLFLRDACSRLTVSMPSPGVAASCMATDAISALSQVATECAELLGEVLAALTALCQTAIGRIGLPGRWIQAFGDVFAVMEMKSDRLEMKSATALLTALRFSEGGLDLLVLHTRGIISILLTASKSSMSDSDFYSRVTTTVLAIAAHGGETQLLRENVLSLVHLLITHQKQDQISLQGLEILHALVKSADLADAPSLSSVLGAIYQLIAPATPIELTVGSNQLQESAIQLVARMLDAEVCVSSLEATGTLEAVAWAICQQPRYRPAIAGKIVKALHNYPSLASATKFGCAANIESECDSTQAFQLEPVLAVARQTAERLWNTSSLGSLYSQPPPARLNDDSASASLQLRVQQLRQKVCCNEFPPIGMSTDSLEEDDDCEPLGKEVAESLRLTLLAAECARLLLEKHSNGLHGIRAVPSGLMPSNQVVFDTHGPYSTSQDLGSLKFDSNFESGNLGKAIQVWPNVYDLLLDFDFNTNRYTQWFHFRVSGALEGIQYRFNIVNLEKPQSLYNFGMRPLLRSPGRPWRRAGTSICYYSSGRHVAGRSSFQHTLSFQLQFDSAGECVLCMGVPYTVTDLDNDLSSLFHQPMRAQWAKQADLVTTPGGLPFKCITVSDDGGEIDKSCSSKPVVVISARVHPGEANASWLYDKMHRYEKSRCTKSVRSQVMRGVLDMLTGDSKTAQHLRQTLNFVLFPMLNPDGVTLGNYRCSTSGLDLNRQYQSSNAPAEIHNLKKFVKTLQGRVAVFCDLHGHSRKFGAFMYGCAGASRNATTERQLIPLLLSRRTKAFNMASCSFGCQKAKYGTGRVVMCREFGIESSFTLESSFAGPFGGSHFNVSQLEQLGGDLCAAIGEWHNCRSPGGKGWALSELTPLVSNRVADHDSGSDSDSADNTQPEPPAPRELIPQTRNPPRTATKTRSGRQSGLPHAHIHRGIRAAAKLERNAAVHARALHSARLSAKPPSGNCHTTRPSPRYKNTFQSKVSNRPSTSRVQRPSHSVDRSSTSRAQQLGGHRPTNRVQRPTLRAQLQCHHQQLQHGAVATPPNISEAAKKESIEDCEEVTVSFPGLDSFKAGEPSDSRQPNVTLDYKADVQLEKHMSRGYMKQQLRSDATSLRGVRARSRSGLQAPGPSCVGTHRALMDDPPASPSVVTVTLYKDARMTASGAPVPSRRPSSSRPWSQSTPTTLMTAPWRTRQRCLNEIGFIKLANREDVDAQHMQMRIMRFPKYNKCVKNTTKRVE